jgi:hypothetical protein
LLPLPAWSGVREAEPAEEFLERICLGPYGDSLARRDIDHCGLELRGKLGEGLRRPSRRDR